MSQCPNCKIKVSDVDCPKCCDLRNSYNVAKELVHHKNREIAFLRTTIGGAASDKKAPEIRGVTFEEFKAMQNRACKAEVRASEMSDHLGTLNNINTTLLVENANLRRALETLERREKKR